MQNLLLFIMKKNLDKNFIFHKKCFTCYNYIDILFSLYFIIYLSNNFKNLIDYKFYILNKIIKI